MVKLKKPKSSFQRSQSVVLRFSAIQDVGLMAILNITPDSFSDGGKFMSVRTAVQRALQMVDEGAAVIDIGGESSRPGARPVSVQEELNRVLPVIKAIRKKSTVPLSIDTYKPEVAAAALQAGATWVNDITGLCHPVMRKIVAQYNCTVIIMHMLGSPQTMQLRPRYTAVITDIKKFFVHQTKLARQAGIKTNKIILDPGIGFGKMMNHNRDILRRLHEFKILGYPILVGASRKSFTGKNLPGTLAAHAIAVQNGATWLRVHDVAAHRQFFRLWS